MFTIFPITFNMGLNLTESLPGNLILYTMPLWSSWLARVAGSEHLSARQIGGVVFTRAGVAVALIEQGLRLAA